MTNQDFFGLSAALITPFDEQGAVDLGRLTHHARHVLAEGCDTVTLFGTTGEGFSLAMHERAAMLGALRGVGIEGEKIYAGVMASAVFDAIAQARMAYGFGARGILLSPPFFFKGLDDEGLFSWFSAVIDGIGDLARGVILYHIPGQTNVPLSVGLIDRVKRALLTG